MQGIDWRSNTRLDQNPNNLKAQIPDFPALNGPNNNRLMMDGINMEMMHWPEATWFL